MMSKWSFWRDWIFLIGFLCRSNSLETRSFLLCAGLRQMATGSQRLGVGFPPVKRLTSRCRFTPSSPAQLLGSLLPPLLSQLPDVPWPHLWSSASPFQILPASSQHPVSHPSLPSGHLLGPLPPWIVLFFWLCWVFIAFPQPSPGLPWWLRQ